MSVFSVDFDGDGDYDLAVASSYASNVSILLNNGDGTFAAAVNYGAGGSPVSVFSADFDGDGDYDLAVANLSSKNVSIWLNNGDGTFAAAGNYGAGDTPWSVFSADLDGDGDYDLAVANVISDNVSILFNLSDVNSQGGAISGIITETGSATPIEGVAVKASLNGADKGTGITDNNGNYSITNLPPGTYDAEASKFGYESGSRENVQVIAGQTTIADFQLTPLPTADVSGFVYDGPTMSGLEGVLVEFLYDDVVRYSVITEASTGLYGRNGVFAGTYGVRYSKDGYHTAILETTVPPGWQILQPVTLYPLDYISSQPLKDAMDEFSLAYYDYLDRMGDVIVTTLAYQYQLMYLQEFQSGKETMKKALLAASAADDLTKWLALINYTKEWTISDGLPLSAASNFAWGK